MSVNQSYVDFVADQLGRIVSITTRRMFGGVGVYGDGLFFAVLDDDALYFKVDDSNRADFEKAGKGPFKPFGDDGGSMNYYEVPAELLEDVEAIRPWVEKAMDVARSKKRVPRKKKK